VHLIRIWVPHLSNMAVRVSTLRGDWTSILSVDVKRFSLGWKTLHTLDKKNRNFVFFPLAQFASFP
jgi:hypothetical protein